MEAPGERLTVVRREIGPIRLGYEYDRVGV
jgi:hypothetical protein